MLIPTTYAEFGCRVIIHFLHIKTTYGIGARDMCDKNFGVCVARASWRFLVIVQTSPAADFKFRPAHKHTAHGAELVIIELGDNELDDGWDASWCAGCRLVDASLSTFKYVVGS